MSPSKNAHDHNQKLLAAQNRIQLLTIDLEVTSDEANSGNHLHVIYPFRLEGKNAVSAGAHFNGGKTNAGLKVQQIHQPQPWDAEVP
jgi:hypothetical protein